MLKMHWGSWTNALIMNSNDFLPLSAALKQTIDNQPFDAGTYLEKKQIYAQLFTDKRSSALTREYKRHLTASLKFRTTIIQNLQKEFQ
jgi:hypothetical protein